MLSSDTSKSLCRPLISRRRDLSFASISLDSRSFVLNSCRALWRSWSLPLELAILQAPEVGGAMAARGLVRGDGRAMWKSRLRRWVRTGAAGGKDEVVGDGDVQPSSDAAETRDDTSQGTVSRALG